MMNTQNEEISEVFIGARNLADQIDMILPTFDLLMDQIDQIRATAKLENVKAHDNSKYTQYKKDINNTIGIFGARGTGKTSVLYTTINKLKGNIDNCQMIFPKPENIILPIIEPDQFGDNTKIIGSIVGLLKNVVEEQLLEIERNHNKDDEDYFNKCVYKLNNPLKKSLNELIEYHMYTATEYRNLLINNYDDMATHVKKSANLLIPDIEFKQKLHRLISLLIEKKRDSLKKGKNSSDPVSEPLIFLFIDDIDLKTNKVRELVEALLQYANHPNIVTVLSGDYNILQESLMLTLIQDEKLQENNLSTRFKINSKQTMEQRKKELATEYLKKVIPPVRRHQLVKWGIRSIPYFAFGKNTLSNQLNRLLNNKNIFNYYDEERKAIFPIHESYRIFDNTPRGIVNVYYHINEINSKYSITKINKSEKEKLFNSMKLLINTFIMSSSVLLSQQEYILNEFIKWNDYSHNTFINYYRIIENTNNENFFEIMLLGEFLKDAIEHIEFDLQDFNRAKRRLFYNLFEIESNTFDFEINILDILKTLVEYTDFRTLSLFKEFLSQFSTIQHSENILFQEEKLTILAIHKLVEEHNTPDLFTTLYQLQDNEKDIRINRFFRFLQFACARTEKSKEVIELYKNYFSFIKNSSKLFDQLYINMFIYITALPSNKLEELGEKLDNGNLEKHFSYTSNKLMQRKKKSKLSNTLKLIKSKQINILNLKENQQNIIDAMIKTYAIDINDILEKYDRTQATLRALEDNIVKNGIMKFIAGNSGSENTNYSIAKNLIKHEIDIHAEDFELNYESYKKIIGDINKLKNNAFNWYGKQEAYDLLVIFQQQLYLDPAFLEYEDIIIINDLHYYLYVEKNMSIENQNYNFIKEDLRNKMAKSFNEVKRIKLDDLDDLGLSLIDDELFGISDELEEEEDYDA